VDHRERLVRQRVALNNTLQWHLHDLWPELQLPGSSLFYGTWGPRVARRLARAEQTMRVRIARDELRRIRELSHTIKALEAQIAQLVAQIAPHLLSQSVPGAETMNALGPVGLASRALAGVALIVLPIVSHGLAVWDVIGALAVLPAISVVFHRLLTAAVARLALSTGRPGSGSARTWTVNLSALIAILAIGTVLTYVTPIDAGAIWLFFGFSLLVAAVRRDAA
jgi:hypothetical protein